MTKIVISTAILVLFSSLVHSNEKENLDKFRIIFENHMHDFRSFHKSYGEVYNFDESNICNEILHIVAITREYILSNITFTDIYNLISTKKDRVSIRPIIQLNIKYYISSLDESIRYINHLISSTKSPGIAASATRLRDDLRGFQQLLQSIKLPE